MGHAQQPDAGDLGLGWVYYAAARIARVRRAVVIGSYRGFVPAVIGRAFADAGGGEVVFIDPSLVDDFWCDPVIVQSHFQRFGIENVRHHLVTTQEFASSDAFERLPEIGLLFVDGLHTEEQARFDYGTFENKLANDGLALFHDSVRERTSRIYGADRPYVHTVCRYMDELRADPRFEVLSLEQGDGLTMVRKR